MTTTNHKIDNETTFDREVINEAPLAPEASPLEDADRPAPDPRLELGSSEKTDTPAGGKSRGGTPEERAVRTADHWKGGIEETFACAIEVDDAWRAFRDDPASMQRYADCLVETDMLTKLEAADPKASAKLSSLRKIAEHLTVLRGARVSKHVGAGVSKLAICARIAEQIPGGEAEKIQGLSKVLEACPNEEVDRRYLIAQNKRLKRELNAPPSQDDEAPEEPAESAGTTTIPEVIEQKKRFGRVLLTPGDSDMRLFKKILADPDQLERQLPLKKIFAESAGLVILAEVRDLAFIQEHPLFRASFSRPASVFLLRNPTGHYISNATVLIAFDRGDVRRDAAICEIWADDAETFDAAAMAARIYPGGHWLHLFAEKPTEGSTTVVGDDSWLEAPGGSK
jgi:hypothetical protein